MAIRDFCIERNEFLSAMCPAERCNCTACRDCDDENKNRNKHGANSPYEHLDHLIKDGKSYFVFVDVLSGVVHSTPEYVSDAPIPNVFPGIETFYNLYLETSGAEILKQE